MKILKNTRIYCSFLTSQQIPKMKIEKMVDIIDCKDEIAVVKAVQCLLNEQVIAVPTDTIYGLACSANCPDAIRKLYKIKGRDSARPVAICVTNITDVRQWGEAKHLHDNLLNNLLPGPITIVLEKTKNLNNPYLNPQTTKIGIRIPKHKFINKVTKLFNNPVALTSANFSNESSSLCIAEFEKLYDKLGAVYDGGVLSQGLDVNRSGSTVVDLSQPGLYKVIRKGISYEQIIDVLEKYGINKYNI